MFHGPSLSKPRGPTDWQFVLSWGKFHGKKSSLKKLHIWWLFPCGWECSKNIRGLGYPQLPFLYYPKPGDRHSEEGSSFLPWWVSAEGLLDRNCAGRGAVACFLGTGTDLFQLGHCHCHGGGEAPHTGLAKLSRRHMSPNRWVLLHYHLGWDMLTSDIGLKRC